MEFFESAVEQAIREARERGEFDNLPSAGKPLRHLGTDDPDWWVKAYAAREGLDLSAALPAPLALRKEAEGFPASLAELATETSVRAVLDDFNRRVRQERLRPTAGPLPPVLAPLVDVDAMVARWADLRRASQPVEVDPAPVPVDRASGRWWRRLLRRP